MSDLLDPAPLPEGLGIPAEDWQQTPLSVRLVVLHPPQTPGRSRSAVAPGLLQLQSAAVHRCARDKSANDGCTLPSAASLAAKPGHPGHPQVLLEPTATVSLFPEACACGHRGADGADTVSHASGH